MNYGEGSYGVGNYGTTTAAAPQSVVQGSIGCLHKSTDSLLQIVAELHNRLHPVLRPVPPEPGQQTSGHVGATLVAPSQSDVASGIMRGASSVEDAVNGISALLGRLEV